MRLPQMVQPVKFPPSMIDVVIQGAALHGGTKEWEKLAGSTSVSRPSPGVVRLHDVRQTDGVAEHARSRSVDWAVLNPPRSWTEFRLLAMDMDSTLITIECIDQLADIAGVGTQVANITTAAMRGELDFQQALRARVRLLAGLDVSALGTVYAERLKLSPGATILLNAARRAGLKTLLVSGGFTYFTRRLQERLQLDFELANSLEVIDGKLTGAVEGEIVDAHAKAQRVVEVCHALGCPTDAAIVVGDGANDLEMMAIAGLSVAYRAKPRVQSHAHVAINHSGLDAIVHLLE